MKHLVILVLAGLAATAAAEAPPRGPGKPELARLARCKKDCKLTAKPGKDAWYAAKFLPVATQVTTPRATVDVPAHWTLSTGAAPDFLGVVLVGPFASPSPSDATHFNLEIAAPDYPIPPENKWIEGVQHWGRAIDVQLPVADTEHDKTSKVTWNGQPWVVREVDQKGSAKLWYAITYKGKNMYFIVAMADLAHQDAMRLVLASVQVR